MANQWDRLVRYWRLTYMWFWGEGKYPLNCQLNNPFLWFTCGLFSGFGTNNWAIILCMYNLRRTPLYIYAIIQYPLLTKYGLHCFPDLVINTCPSALVFNLPSHPGTSNNSIYLWFVFVLIKGSWANQLPFFLLNTYTAFSSPIATCSQCHDTYLIPFKNHTYITLSSYTVCPNLSKQVPP